MDPEKPRSLRSLITRIVFTLVGIMLVYLLGAGPAAYLWDFSEKSHTPIAMLYDPLLHRVRGTPLEDVLAAYQVWWAELGRSPSDDPSLETPPAPP